MRSLPLILTAAGLGLTATPALAQSLNVSVEIPRIASASYHRPYVAIWIERPDQTAVQTLAVWYDIALPAGEGKDWLKDMRTWWRRGGRAMTMPADGISGATRAPGRHTVSVPAARLRNLPAGQYVMVVEAARELGGREAVRVPFRWGGANTANATGSTELGAVRVTVAR
ncbi:DUF2271 domain-containing protein [Brevundimonas vitis]|uniref:DUF2271 domain-containing protein n=1 Tax=Brevundimonas vitisensis TaxID=2800818 RepID=A0ABX7BQR0_9CAUL|nr:DUF2271 domain-containing protein [Brevundimonas vitisensis]QQQ19795.1 DUF2271 domain-containing protein [Brevundimonas vitisensis]